MPITINLNIDINYKNIQKYGNINIHNTKY